MHIEKYRIEPSLDWSNKELSINEVVEIVLDLSLSECINIAEHNYDRFISMIVNKSAIWGEKLKYLKIVMFIVPYTIKSVYNNYCTGFAFRFDGIYYVIITQHTDVKHVIGHELSHVFVDVIFPASKELAVEELERFIDEFHQLVVENENLRDEEYYRKYFGNKYLGEKNE